MQGSLLDAEAQARGTTVYLVDRRLDMLPGLLSEHLCSLVGESDRLAVSAIWTLSPNLEVQHAWFGRTVIRQASWVDFDCDFGLSSQQQYLNKSCRELRQF